MGLSWCGWQCPQAVTRQPRTTLRPSEKCGCASFNGWDKQGKVCEGKWRARQLQTQTGTYLHRQTNPQSDSNTTNMHRGTNTHT